MGSSKPCDSNTAFDLKSLNPASESGTSDRRYQALSIAAEGSLARQLRLRWSDEPMKVIE
jgi:hypothetical protein